MAFEFRRVKEHIEVYINNTFQFSADTEQEAEHDIRNYIEQKGITI